MTGNKKLQAFVSTTNAEKAKSFYRNCLGLTLVSEDEYALEFEENGTLLRVSIVRELKPQPFTVLGWNVDDIASAIKSLNDQNIFCEKYEFLEQNDLGIWTSPNGSKVAWFKDPDGNILSFTES
jgi:catechol 2,3-dioxygenase-like lactoylglutathione lyase family enzyme